MKQKKYKHNVLQILKRFLKENRDLIKFYYLGPRIKKALMENNVSIWSSLGEMISQRSRDMNISYSDLIREYTGGKETYATIANRLHDWNKKNGYYDTMSWDDENNHYKYIIRKRKQRGNDKENNSHC